jgi:hypothetical protein
MSIDIVQAQRTSNPIKVTFPAPVEQPPVVLVTPFWKGQGEPVSSIETVTEVTVNDCKISSANQASNYWVNILVIDANETSIGTLGMYAGVHEKVQAGMSTINFPARLKSNDPVALLAPKWTSPVGYSEYVVTSAASEIQTYSKNSAPGGAYSIEYLATDRGASAFQKPFFKYSQIETGTYNKTGSGTYRIYFQSPFSVPPVVFLTPWWDGTQSILSSIETVGNVTKEYFEAISGNSGSNYFVNWMAFGNT